MLWLSEVLLQAHDLESFEQLKETVGERARGGPLRRDVGTSMMNANRPLAPRLRLYGRMVEPSGARAT